MKVRPAKMSVQIGACVLVRREYFLVKESKKLDSIADGPYEIVSHNYETVTLRMGQ